MNYRRKVVALVATAMMCFGGTAWAGNGQNLLQYVPQDTSVFFVVDMDQVRAMPMWQMVWGLVMANPDASSEFAEFSAATGFDPNLHLNTILVALGQEEEQVSILVEGTFDSGAFGVWASGQDDVTTMDYAGHTVYYNPTSDDDPYATFLSNTLMAIGSQNELSAVVDNAAGTGNNVTANAAVSGLLSSVTTSSTMWFAGTISPYMSASMAETPFAGLQNIYGDISFDSGMAVNYVLGAADAEQAAGLAAFLQAMLGEAASDPQVAAMGLGEVLTGTSIAADGANVSISATLSEETMTMVMGMMMALSAGGGDALPE